MNKYTKKQIKIALVYILILAIISTGIFLIISSKGPSCNDKIQNQGEEGVDCGGPCPPCPWQLQKPVEVIFVKAFSTQENYVDLVAKIRNPNKEFGIKSFDYIFKLYDLDNNLIATKEGTSYLLPQKTKYIISQRNLVNSKISRIDFEIKNVQWQQLSEYQEPEFLIKNINLDQDEKGARLSGNLENRSSYNFAEVDIYAVLKNKNSEIVAVSKHKLYTVLSQELRYFELNWPFPLSEEIEELEILAETNVFENTNFIKEYQRKEREYYR